MSLLPISKLNSILTVAIFLFTYRIYLLTAVFLTPLGVTFITCFAAILYYRNFSNNFWKARFSSKKLNAGLLFATNNWLCCFLVDFGWGGGGGLAVRLQMDQTLRWSRNCNSLLCWRIALLPDCWDALAKTGQHPLHDGSAVGLRTAIHPVQVNLWAMLLFYRYLSIIISYPEVRVSKHLKTSSNYAVMYTHLYIFNYIKDVFWK